VSAVARFATPQASADGKLAHLRFFLCIYFVTQWLNEMVNIFTEIKKNNFFQKVEVSELLFVEYTCMVQEDKFGIWSNNNYFAFISSGKKIWQTIYHSYEVEEGDIIFVKKGANLAHQFFNDDFCAIFMFIPDDFIKAFLKRNTRLLNTAQKHLSRQDAVLRVQPDELLKNYRDSIQSYLLLPKKPNEQLLLLKFEELLLSLFSNEKHRELTDYFISLSQDRQYHMARVMEENFAYNLNLDDYAQLCHMSLSTFKKSFKEYYGTTPAAWLQARKLEHARHQVLNSELSISQLALESGFEDASHFIRLFKQKFDLTPLQFRQQHSQTVINES
jgi:AraC family transcriptional regulator, exoenzyme S synthesis regulatory protein ExsA